MTISVAMVGAGWVSGHHLQAYRRLEPRARVVAIADPSAEAREGRASEFGIERTYADAAEMLQAGGYDAVDVVSPRHLHARHVLLAAGHGRPVMCQKPLAASYAEAKALVDALGGRVPLMVHKNWSWRPHYRTIKSWIEGGMIGARLQTQMLALTSGLLSGPDGLLPALVRQRMFADLERLLIMEVLIHHIDALRFLLGDLELQAAHHGRISDQVRGEDHAAMMLRTASGGSVLLAGNYCADGYAPALDDQLEILGQSGTIRLKADSLKLIGRESMVETLDLDANYRASYRAAIGHFFDCLESGMAFETCPDDNLKTLEIVERAYTEGRAVGAKLG